MAAFRFLINRLMTLSIQQKEKETEWTTILGIAKINGFPRNNIERLKEKLIRKKHQLTDKEPTKCKWIPFTYFGPEVRKKLTSSRA